MEDSACIWFVDGACSLKNNRAGIGVYNKDHNIKESLCIDDLFDKKTNSIAELYCVKHALSIIKNIKNNRKNIIFSDSEYAVKSLTKWIIGWKKKNWLKSDNKPVMHKELLSEIYDDLTELSLDIIWIPREKNTEADRLAKFSIY